MKVRAGNRQGWRWGAAAGWCTAAMIAMPLWGVDLEWMKQGENWIEREQHGKSGVPVCPFWCESGHIS
ncbi:MAG: hypothetical protein OXD50_16520 [Chloroflexi bacterium]|nr:hypothetical protein [Chloroflexota bacterium]